MTPAPSQDHRRVVARPTHAAAETDRTRRQTLTLAIQAGILAAALLAASFMMETTGAAVAVAVVGAVAAVAALAVLARVTFEVGPLGLRAWAAPAAMLALSAVRLLMLLA